MSDSEPQKRTTSLLQCTEQPVRLSLTLIGLMLSLVGAVIVIEYSRTKQAMEDSVVVQLRANARMIASNLDFPTVTELLDASRTSDHRDLYYQNELAKLLRPMGLFIDASIVRLTPKGSLTVVSASQPDRMPSTDGTPEHLYRPEVVANARKTTERMISARELRILLLSSDEPVVMTPAVWSQQPNFFHVFAPLLSETDDQTGVLCLVYPGEHYGQAQVDLWYRVLGTTAMGSLLAVVLGGLVWTSLKNQTNVIRASKNILKALSVSEQRMKVFVQHAPSAVAMFDQDLKYIAYSRRWLRAFELDERVEWAGKSHYDVVSNVSPRLREIHQRCLAGESHVMDREHSLSPNGKSQWYQWEVHPWRDPQGAIGGLLMSARDITQEIEQQQLVEDQRNRLDLAVQSANLATWDLDVCNEFMHFAGRGLTLIGFDLSVKFLSTRRWYEKIHPEDIQRVNEAFQSILTAKSPELRVEYRMRRVDGSWAWISSVGRVTAYDDNGVAIRAMGVSMDVSAEKAAELALETATTDVHRLATAIDSHSDAVLLANPQGKITRVNRAFEAITGFTPSEALGEPLGSLEHSPAHSSTYREMWKTILSGRPWSGRQCNRRRWSDGDSDTKHPGLYWTDVSVSPIRSANGTIDGFVSVQRDVTDEVLREERLAVAARTDELTGLGNRQYLQSRLERAIELQKRRQDYHFAVLFLDVDRFKLINDSLGHQVGDHVLQEVASRLRSLLRVYDTVLVSSSPEHDAAVRWGGDEFVIVLDNLERPEDAVRVAERILSDLAQPYHVDGHVVQASASIGIVFSSRQYQQATDILRDADIALFEAKSRGKARWVIFDESMQVAVERRLELENSLRSQQNFSQFHLVYQPIVSANSTQLCGVEALLRWRHPKLGMVSPLEFIPIAEECHMITALGRWVLEQACRQWLAWHQSAPELAPDYVTVNISRIQLTDAGFLAQVQTILQETGMDPRRLVFEITESTVMKDPGRTKELLREIKSLGIRLAIDDFGTGHSSLSCLHEFPFDILKIDRSFVSSFAKSPEVVSMTQAIITLAKHLGMACVAEGTELASEVEVLRRLDCDLIQGYFFGRPMPPEELIGIAWRSHNIEPLPTQSPVPGLPLQSSPNDSTATFVLN